MISAIEKSTIKWIIIANQIMEIILKIETAETWSQYVDLSEVK